MYEMSEAGSALSGREREMDKWMEREKRFKWKDKLLYIEEGQ